MFTNLNTDPAKKPRLLGLLGDLSHAKVSSSDFKYVKHHEIFGQAEPAEYIYQVIEGAVRTHKLLSDGRRQIGAFHLPGDIFGLENGEFHRFTALSHLTWIKPFSASETKVFNLRSCWS